MPFAVWITLVALPCSLGVQTRLLPGEATESSPSQSAVVHEHMLRQLNYDSYLQRFRPGERRLMEDAATLEQRQAMFEKQRGLVLEQNSKEDGRWVAGINHFADHLPEERAAMLGYRRTSASAAMSGGASLMQAKQNKGHLQASVDWRTRLNSSRFVRDQGACGSCWAIASIGALESYVELAEKGTWKLPHSELVNCMPNPHLCGGSGGCAGATAELAFDFVKEHGLDVDERGAATVDDCKKSSKGDRLVVDGFVQLPVNAGVPLMSAVATEGPVVVSVAASEWFSYHSGIFDGCSQDAVVNHAVLLVGYGQQKGEGRGGPYWLIRNSWGPHWGEAGHMRLLRHEEDAAYCGTDRDPQAGVGCAGGPPTITVCGMCGILSDSSYPVGVRLAAAGAVPALNVPEK